jgi:hypothetical protein
MFKHFWPEESCCDKCGSVRSGAMLYISNVPVSFVCEVCDPNKHHKAILFSKNISDEVEMNGWEWLNL